MIDWSALVADSAPNLPENEANSPCSYTPRRNKPAFSEIVGTAVTRAPSGLEGLCSDVPSVPHVFERGRVDEHKKRNPSSFIEPAGGGFEGQSAPHKTPVEPACRTCAHRHRPGLSDGYCGSRSDLPPAYTSGHPLHQLPDDGGANCSDWTLHPGFDTGASPG